MVFSELYNRFAPDFLTRDRFFPAHDFEHQSGMKDIGGRYHIIPDHTSRSLFWTTLEASRKKEEDNSLSKIQSAFIKCVYGRLATDAEFSEFQKIFDELRELNPSLRNVKVDRNDEKQVYEFITGVTSGFNPEDIDFFINTVPKMDQEKRLNYRAYCDLLEGQNGVEIGWFPSPSTINKMEGHFGPENCHIDEHKIAERAAILKTFLGEPEASTNNLAL
ncbi:MAG: hypothetical protein ACT4OY_00635 [Alphaproteobacteria bacterium]